MYSISVCSSLGLSTGVPRVSGVSSLLKLDAGSVNVVNVVPFFSVVFPSVCLNIVPGFGGALSTAPSPSFSGPGGGYSLSALL